MLKKEGFKFSFDSSKCEECGGKCCSGESGYIFVTPNEIIKIAKFLNIDFENFCYKYIKKVGYRYSLLETIENENNYSCIFFKNGKCSIYEVRPNQCVSFPFWDGFKDDFTDLLKECIGVCEK